MDGTLQSGCLDQPRSSFNGAPIMIIHADDVDEHDADGADGVLVEDDSGEVAKSKLDDSHEAKDNDQDDDQENEASVKL